METPVRLPAPAWGVANAVAPGEKESGDAYLVHTRDGYSLAAVIDALGHGHDAAQAAAVAIASLREFEPGASLEAIVRDCHQRMRGTRGAALGLALFDWAGAEMHWIGVGNVAGFWLTMGSNGGTQARALVSHAGVVGDRLPRLAAFELEVKGGDTMVMATDGVHDAFVQTLTGRLPPQVLANLIVRRYSKSSDDALALVFRCNGT